MDRRVELYLKFEKPRNELLVHRPDRRAPEANPGDKIEIPLFVGLPGRGSMASPDPRNGPSRGPGPDLLLRWFHERR